MGILSSIETMFIPLVFREFFTTHIGRVIPMSTTYDYYRTQFENARDKYRACVIKEELLEKTLYEYAKKANAQISKAGIACIFAQRRMKNAEEEMTKASIAPPDPEGRSLKFHLFGHGRFNTRHQVPMPHGMVSAEFTVAWQQVFSTGIDVTRRHAARCELQIDDTEEGVDGTFVSCAILFDTWTFVEGSPKVKAVMETDQGMSQLKQFMATPEDMELWVIENYTTKFADDSGKEVVQRGLATVWVYVAE